MASEVHSQIANRLGFSSPPVVHVQHLQCATPCCCTFPALQRCRCMGFTHDCYGIVLLTHKHIGMQTVRFYFSLKGLMEGLNNCVYYVHVIETMNSHYSSIHGLSRGQLFQGSSSRTSQTNGESLTYKQSYALTEPLILTPYISQKPLFLLKIITQTSYFFHTVQNF